MLVQQRLGRANPWIGVEPPPHHPIVKSVVEREERHSLVMDHVTMDGDPGRASRFAAPRIIDRHVLTEIAQHGGVTDEGE